MDLIVRDRHDSAVLGGSSLSSDSPDRSLFHRYPVQLSDGFTFVGCRLEGGFRLEERARRLIGATQEP